MHKITEAKRFGFQLLNKELTLSTDEETRESILKAYDGDFWQDGKAVLLPPISPTSAGQKAAVSLKGRYISRNIMKECLERVSSAYLGKAPQLRFIIDNEQIDVAKLRRLAELEDEEKDEALKEESMTNEMLEKFKDKLEDFEEMQKVLNICWSKYGMGIQLIEVLERRLAAGRSGARIFVQAKYKEEDEQKYVEANSLADAAKHIKIEYIDRDKGRFLDDEGEKFSIVKYETRKNWDTDEKIDEIEFSFLDEDDNTGIVIIDKDDSEDFDALIKDTDKASEPIDLDGNTTYFEIKGKPYISSQFYTQNQLVNLALTTGGLNLVDAGFKEMITTNVAVKTKKIIDKESGDEIEVPVAVERGGGITQNLVGLQEKDMMSGKINYSQPGVHFRDPASMQTFIDGEELGYVSCLKEVGQQYVQISGDAVASSISRVQAMADFVLKIKRYKAEVDCLSSWAMTVVMKFIAAIASSTAFEDVSIQAESIIKVAILTPEEKEMIMKLVEADLISKETARMMLEIDSAKLEEELIEREKKRASDLMPDMEPKEDGEEEGEVDEDGKPIEPKKVEENGAQPKGELKSVPPKKVIQT